MCFYYCRLPWFFLSFLRLEGDFNFSPFHFFLSPNPCMAPPCFLSNSCSFKKLLLHFFSEKSSVLFIPPHAPSSTLSYPHTQFQPFLFHNSLSIIQSNVFYLPSLESPFPQTLSNYLISMGILNRKHIAKDSMITSHTDERKHLTFVFLGLGHLIQNDSFHLHPFTCKLYSYVNEQG